MWHYDVHHYLQLLMERLQNVEDICTRMRQEGFRVEENGERIRVWHELHLSSGWPGLCVMFGALDRLEPENGWDELGHQVLVRLHLLLQTQGMPTGLWHGLSGIVMGVQALSRGGTRYQNLLDQLLQVLVERVQEETRSVAEELMGMDGGDLNAESNLHDPSNEGTSEVDRERRPIDTSMMDIISGGPARSSEMHGIAIGKFDVISGLTGMGRTLLEFASRADIEQALRDLLRVLVRLSGNRQVNGQTVPAWFTDPYFLMEHARREAPNGNLNLGLSHGIAGPLALMSLCLLRGIEVEGMREVVERIVGLLYDWEMQDDHGSLWHGSLTWEQWTAGHAEPNEPERHRESWCYGTIGISRAIWLAGKALGQPSLQEQALDSFLAALMRAVERNDLSAPSLCHGLAGAIYLAHVMWEDTRDPRLETPRDLLIYRLLDRFDAETPLGYQDTDPGYPPDNPGLLNGTAGITLVLAHLLHSEPSRLDALLMLR